MKLKYILLVFLFVGCGNSGYEEIAPGLKMKKITEGKGRGMLNGSDYFYLNVHLMDEKDKPFTNVNFNPDFVYLAQLQEPSYSYDFIQALPSMKKADSLSFECLADSLFLYYYGTQAPSQLAGKNIHLHVQVVNIMSEAEYYEKLENAREASKNNAYIEFESYLRNNNITAEPIGTGTILVTLQEGTGPVASYKDVVSIHMVQKTFSGIEIENTRKTGGTFEYEIGGDGGLKGLDEALVKMRKGGKAMVYLPHFLAFGESGIPPKVPPYANITMELELVDIRKPY